MPFAPRPAATFRFASARGALLQKVRPIRRVLRPQGLAFQEHLDADGPDVIWARGLIGA